MTRAIFIISEGWICTGPSAIQRCAPMPITPMRLTATRSRSETA